MYIVDHVKFLAYLFVILEGLVCLSMPCVLFLFCSIVYYILLFCLNYSHFLILSGVCDFYCFQPSSNNISLVHEFDAKCLQQKNIYFDPDEVTA